MLVKLSGWGFLRKSSLRQNPFRRMDTEKIQAGKPAQVRYSPIDHSYFLLYQEFNPDSILWSWR